MRIFSPMINAKRHIRPQIFKILLLSALALSLPSCAVMDFISNLGGDEKPNNEDEHAGWSAKQLYDEAKRLLMDGSYEKAARLYEKLEARYPFGTFATQAQLDVAYAYYKNQEWDAALAAVDRFIKLNPANERVDYALYLRGLINYNKGKTFADRFVPTDSSQRDPGAARDSMKDFSELVERFPQSRYTSDAQKRIINLRNNLAMYEYHVADFYMRRGAYVASVRRCNDIIEKFPRTHAIPFALKLLEDGYRKLELNDLADNPARVYVLNYGDSAHNQYSDSEYELTPAEVAWDFIGFDH